MMFKPFDILLYKGKSHISAAIKSFTNSPYSHIALVLDDKHVVEINMTYKLQIKHLEYPKGDFSIYRLKCELSQEQQEQIYEYIYSTLAAEYDFKEIFGFILYKLFRIKISNSYKKFVCSSWVNECFKSCGIVLSSEEYVSPQDLISDKLYLVKNKGNEIKVNDKTRTI